MKRYLVFLGQNNEAHYVDDLEDLFTLITMAVKNGVDNITIEIKNI